MFQKDWCEQSHNSRTQTSYGIARENSAGSIKGRDLLNGSIQQDNFNSYTSELLKNITRWYLEVMAKIFMKLIQQIQQRPGHLVSYIYERCIHYKADLKLWIY